LNGLSLEAEAKLMKAIGCYDAMNLDGGASRGLAHNGTILVTPGRNLTNVIVVYDTKNPAPQSLVKSWIDFQNSHGARVSAE
jgi:exopolysaccharide biosynthesis protein